MRFSISFARGPREAFAPGACKKNRSPRSPVIQIRFFFATTVYPGLHGPVIFPQRRFVAPHPAASGGPTLSATGSKMAAGRERRPTLPLRRGLYPGRDEILAASRGPRTPSLSTSLSTPVSPRQSRAGGWRDAWSRDIPSSSASLFGSDMNTRFSLEVGPTTKAHEKFL